MASIMYRTYASREHSTVTGLAFRRELSAEGGTPFEFFEVYLPGRPVGPHTLRHGRSHAFDWPAAETAPRLWERRRESFRAVQPRIRVKAISFIGCRFRPVSNVDNRYRQTERE
jgi:hypothetical protein